MGRALEGSDEPKASEGPSVEPFETEELWHLLEKATLGVWKWEIDADRITASPRLCRALGIERTHTTDRDIEKLVHGGDRRRYRRLIREFLAMPGRYSIELRLRFADDEYRWATARAVAWREQDGRATKAVGWLLDLSERKAELDARAKEAELLQRLMDECPAAFYLKDAKGRHLYVNDQGADLIGASAEAILGKRNEDLFPPETAAKLSAVDRRVLESGETERWSGPIDRGDGDPRYVLDTKFRVTDPFTGEVRLAGFGMDITESWNARERAEARQRLESLGQLAGGIAHDFNNLLTVIVGNAELCRSEPESVPEAAQTIAEVAKSASELCRELLIYAGRQAVELTPLPLETVAEGATELLRMSVVDGPELKTTVAADAPIVCVSAAQLQRVLVNLVLNARQAGAETIEVRYDRTPGPPVADEGGLLRSSLDTDGPLGRISVIDDGEGIVPERLAQVFEPFFTSKETGTGLGLSVVHGVVEQHEGAIRLRSQPGETCFEIYLPIAEEGPRPSGRETRPPRDLGSLRLLVVDDEPLVARIAERLLRRMGAEVETVHSGPEALEHIAEAGTIDGVLLDLSMPGMSGAEVLGHLRESHPELPVLVSSGFARDAIEGGLRQDVEAFLPKPYTAGELAEALGQLLREA